MGKEMGTKAVAERKPRVQRTVSLIVAIILLLGGVGLSTGFIVANAKKAVELNYIDYTDKNAVVNRDLFFKNPMVQHVADPQVLHAQDGYYYMYATSLNMDCYGYSVWRSPNLTDWDDGVECFLPEDTDWGKRNYWAPEVIEVKQEDGTYLYYLHYSAEDTNRIARIGVAVSKSPMGPFKNIITENKANPGRLLKLVNFEDPEAGVEPLSMNVIDVHVFRDDDSKNYIYFVERFKAQSGYENLRIYGAQLADDFYTVLTQPKMLLSPSPEDGMQQAWEVEGVNEGPAMIKRNGIYYLTYSGNGYTHANYGIGYATAMDPLGNFAKFEHNPVLVKSPFSDEPTGTGHHGVLQLSNGEWYSTYHSHIDINTSRDDRQLNLGKIGWRSDGTLYINGPVIAPMLLPDILTDYENLALKAHVTSNKTGGNVNTLIDGEIIVSAENYYDQFLYRGINEGQEPDAIDVDGMVTLTFEFDEKVIVKAFAVYANNIDNKRFPVQIIVDDKYVIDAVNFGEELGHAAIAEIGERFAKKVQFVFSQDEPIRLSEIVIIGR